MTRGIRNNNPGNIIISNIPWLGKKSQNSDGHFEQFTSLRYGCRALLINLESAIKTHKLNTIRKIIHAYAPPEENQTDSYCLSVSQITSISTDEPIEAKDQNKICSIAYAICCVENGPEAIINAGLTKDFFQNEWAEFNLKD